jgi:hypothetical protein
MLSKEKIMICSFVERVIPCLSLKKLENYNFGKWSQMMNKVNYFIFYILWEEQCTLRMNSTNATALSKSFACKTLPVKLSDSVFKLTNHLLSKHFSVSLCPVNYPYPYLAGSYCCPTKFDCYGAPWTYASVCCQYQAYTPCPTAGGCTKGKKNLYLLDLTIDALLGSMGYTIEHPPSPRENFQKLPNTKKIIKPPWNFVQKRKSSPRPPKDFGKYLSYLTLLGFLTMCS